MTSIRAPERGTVLLGKYRVESVIGRGGMGLVVKAVHLGLAEEVAIKLLRDDVALADETIARFIREAQAAVKLKSEHIARIIDVGTFADGKPYMVMELLEGQDIGQVIAERGRLSASLAIDLVIQACEALAEAHSLGIVHRDIKPTNLFLTSRPDGSLLLKVLDFGISKSPSGAELSLTQTWSMLGSPAYMSPEQMRSARDVDARTDIWSLGAVLYEALEGHLPFPAESFSEVCVKVAIDAPAPMVAAPPALAAVVLRCLAKHPDERFASVAELGAALAPLAREPDKAQALVDRMVRMLGRVRRTPAVGVPLTPAASALAPAAGHAMQPLAMQPQAIQPQAMQPQAIQPQAIQPQAIQPLAMGPQVIQPLAMGPQAMQPQAMQPQAMQPQAMQPQAMQPLAMAAGAPFAAMPAASYPADVPAAPRAQPSYPPVGLALPATPPRGRRLTQTQKVEGRGAMQGERRGRGWQVAVVCAVLAIAAAAGVIGASRSDAPRHVIPMHRAPAAPAR